MYADGRKAVREKTLGVTRSPGTIGDIVDKEDWPFARFVLGDPGSPALDVRF